MKKAECTYADQIAELMQLLQMDDMRSFWVGLAECLNWSLIDPRSEDLKIKVINKNENIFVKVYSPKTEQYAEVVSLALSELSALDLSIPLLAPLSLCENALVFEKGQVVGDMLYKNVYSQLEQQGIQKILDRHGLKPLNLFSKIGIISINGQEYAIDPFQDDMSSIFDFVNG